MPVAASSRCYCATHIRQVRSSMSIVKTPTRITITSMLEILHRPRKIAESPSDVYSFSQIDQGKPF